MPGSSTMIVPFSSSGDPGCFTGTLSGPAASETVTVVVARGVGICQHPDSTCMGVVFYSATPVMWSCLSDADLPAFRGWCKHNFTGARILDIDAVKSAIVCPPPTLDAAAHTATHAEHVAAVQSELTTLGKTWLAQRAA